MSPRLRVLHVTTFVHPDKFGGAERVIHGIARAQAKAGHEVIVLSGNHDGLPDAEEIDGFRLARFPVAEGLRGARFFLAVHRSCRRALRALKDRPFDILHTHQLATAVGALGLPGLSRATLHSFYAPYNQEAAVERGADPEHGQPRGGLFGRLVQGAQTALDRRCLVKADRVVVLSRYSAGQIRVLAPRAVLRIAEVPPGVDTDRFRPGDRAAARGRFGWAGPALRVVSVRRLVRRMGLDRAILAVAEVRRAGHDVRLAIAGTGPERAVLERIAAAAGVQDAVSLLGRVEDADLPALYRAADLFLLPTRALEGYGMVTLEALACGTPVLGTAVGATAEVLARFTPEVPLVGASAAEISLGLASALDQLAAWRESAGRAAAEIALHHDWDAVARRLQAVYEETLAGKGAASTCA